MIIDQYLVRSWDLGKHRRLKHRREVHAAAKAPIKVVKLVLYQLCSDLMYFQIINVVYFISYSYKCLECDQQLPNKAALTSHRKAAHGDGDNGKRVKNSKILSLLNLIYFVVTVL